MDEVISPDLAALIYDQVRRFIIRQAREKALDDDDDGGRDGNKEALDAERAEDKGAGATATGGTGDDSIPAESGETTAADASGGEVSPPTSVANPAQASSKTEEKSLGTTGEKGPVHELPVELRDAEVASELAHLDRAYAAKIMYVVGKEQMRIKPNTPLWRKLPLMVFLWIRDNTRAKIANLRLAIERVVEVGFVKEI
jgi:KUP system potassium uptake protein